MGQAKGQGDKAMKYTTRRDGKERVTMRVPLHLTRDEWTQLRANAKRRSESVAEYLQGALYDGLECVSADEAVIQGDGQ